MLGRSYTVRIPNEDSLETVNLPISFPPKEVLLGIDALTMVMGFCSLYNIGGRLNPTDGKGHVSLQLDVSDES
jgi:hypothetical protein